MADPFYVDPNSSIYSLLALSDSDLEWVDLVVLNLMVARGIEALKDLDVARYVKKVDEWTAAFRQFLQNVERNFSRTPSKWKNDIHFFRTGMLACFLGKKIGLSYTEEMKHQKFVWHTNPSDLFLNGLIDTNRGNFANLAQIHVAVSRRMGWPVSICSAGYHWLSRFDNGETSHTIETSHIDCSGFFASSPDEFYIDKFDLPKKAIECGSELRRYTAREMLGVFLACRGRHYLDIRRHDLADESYTLARHLMPNHRDTYVRAMDAAFLSRGRSLFEVGEKRHTDTVFPGYDRSSFRNAETIPPKRTPIVAVGDGKMLLNDFPEVVGAYGCFLPFPPKIQIN